MGIQPIAVPRRSASYFTHLALATVLAGLIASGYVASSMASNAAAHWTHPIRSAPVVTPADYGLSFEDVELMTEDGLRLAAWYVPARNGATLLMLHGLHGNRAGDLALGSDLAERGYGLLLPDLRGHGDSEGEVSTLGFHEVRDVRAALAFLRERPEVDQTRIGVYGASLGAATAIMAAAQLPELQAVVADSSYASVEWLVEHQFNNVVALPTWLAPLVIYLGGQQIGIDAHEIAPIRYVGQISPRPLLLIHGEEDQTFVVENAHLLAEQAGPPVELYVEPGVDHTAAYAADPAGYARRVADFFDHALGAQ